MSSERRDLNGIHFIRVRGNAVERARAHASLLREEILDGALPVLAKKNEWMIRRGPGLVEIPAVQNFIVWLYRRVLIPFYERSITPELKDVMRALSAETGLSATQVREALFQAEGLMFLSRLSLTKTLLRELPAGGLPGCTSAVLLPEWTEGGRVLHLRNQDYPICGPWERHPTVVFQEPTESGQIPHVCVTTAGVHTAGLTGMNAEGLTIATHAHFGKEISFSGQPIVHVGNEVIRRARTLGEAVDITRKQIRSANWAFVIASAKENDAVVIEMSPKRMSVRHPGDGMISHTNFFHSPEMQNQEALISGACCSDLMARLCRTRQVLEPIRGRVRPEDAARILGDHTDAESGIERVFGNTVSVVTTIKSVVFDPGAQTVYVSNRAESPCGLGDFVEIPVSRFWSERPESLREVPGWKPSSPSLLEGVNHYREAYRSWHVENHRPDYAERTLVALRKAVRAYPEDGNLWVQAGLVAFKQRLFEEARGHFAEALSRKLVGHVRAVARLFFARCHDVLGNRERALELYRDQSGVQEPKIRRAFAKGLKRPYRVRQTSELLVDLQFPDVMSY